MIEARVPGKLFIAGEYAVVEPATPSVIIAIDRCIVVRLDEAFGRGQIRSEQFGRKPLVWRRIEGRVVVDRDDRPVDLVLAAISITERYAEEQGIPLRFHDLEITSELDDTSGRKFGLGSSGAVTVATVQVLNDFYQLGLSRMELLKLALVATFAVSPLASGGDVAASTFGGWIAYSGVDRNWLADNYLRMPLSELIAAEWPGLSVKRLDPPAHMQVMVGWTGEPSSTALLVDTVQSRKINPNLGYEEFVSASTKCVERMITAIEADSVSEIQTQVRVARSLLQHLSDSFGLPIETEPLRIMCDEAERRGAAAKTSGAGGGDCGIVIADADTDIEQIVHAWERHGIRRLFLGIHPPIGVDNSELVSATQRDRDDAGE